MWQNRSDMMVTGEGCIYECVRVGYGGEGRERRREREGGNDMIRLMGFPIL